MQTTLGRVLSDVFTLFYVLLFARIIFDNVMAFSRSWRPSGVLIPVLEVIYTVTDPPIKLLRRFIPPLRIGNAALDLSVIVLFIVIAVVQRTVLTRI